MPAVAPRAPHTANPVLGRGAGTIPFSRRGNQDPETGSGSGVHTQGVRTACRPRGSVAQGTSSWGSGCDFKGWVGWVAFSPPPRPGANSPNLTCPSPPPPAILLPSRRVRTCEAWPCGPKDPQAPGSISPWLLTWPRRLLHPPGDS